MNTKLVMSMSAAAMGAAGITLSFIPQEVLGYFGTTSPSVLGSVMLQVLGALYFAFAMTNWTARANLIGGIYGRPIAIGNLTHFVIGALALLKACSTQSQMILLVPAVVYLLFAVTFALIFFTHPMKEKT